MMPLKRVDWVCEQGVGVMNEDTVLVDEVSEVFGVFDGASPLNGGVRFKGATGAYIASHVAAEAFSAMHGSLIDALEAADAGIAAAHDRFGVDTSRVVNRFCTTVAAVRVRDEAVDLLRVCNSLVIVAYRDGHIDIPLGFHDHDAQIMVKWRHLADQGILNVRERLDAEIIALREQANLAYGLVCGDGKAKRFAESATIRRSEIEAILLLTDGLFLPRSNPVANGDWGEYLRLYRAGGLANLCRRVRDQEMADPEMRRYPRYKLHDDASGLALEF